MLSLFPELLFLAPFSALLIRLAAAAVLAYAASSHLKESDMWTRTLGVAEGVCAALFFLGLYTQGAALLGIVLFFVHFVLPRFRIFPLSTAFLYLVLCLSLLITGPGPFTVTLSGVVVPLSFDLPL